MGWFTGNYGRVNREARTRFDDAIGFMQGNQALAEESRARSLGLIKNITSAEMQQADAARSASVEASKQRNARALERGLAASADPIKQGEVAGAAGADRSTVNTLIARGKLEQGILAAEAQQNLSVVEQTAAAKMAAQAAEAGMLGELQEEVDPGMGGDLIQLAGVAIGAKLKDWLKTPEAPAAGGTELVKQKALKEGEVAQEILSEDPQAFSFGDGQYAAELGGPMDPNIFKPYPPGVPLPAKTRPLNALDHEPVMPFLQKHYKTTSIFGERGASLWGF